MMLGASENKCPDCVICIVGEKRLDKVKKNAYNKEKALIRK